MFYGNIDALKLNDNIAPEIIISNVDNYYRIEDVGCFGRSCQICMLMSIK